MKHAVEALQTVAKTANDLIFLIDPDLRIGYVNGSVLNSFACEPQQLIGKPFHDLFPQNGGKSLAEGLKAVFETGRPFCSESKIHRPEQEVWLETSFTGIRNQSGDVHAALGIGRVNRAMAQKLGVSVHEAVGLSCPKFLHGTDQPPSFCPLARLMPGEQSPANPAATGEIP
jgi:PAS domain S-box-containing protein